MPYIGKQLSNGNYLKLDDISSSFDGSTTTFSLTNGGSAYYPGSELSILVSVGGVIQEPESAYQISNDEITFANAPTAQDSFFCVVLGDAIGINVPGNNTVNGAQMAKPFNYDGGLLYLNDTDNRVGINSTSPSVALDVVGDLNVSGNISGIGGTLGGTLIGNVHSTSGISTFNDLLVNGDLTVQGDTTTLNTTLRNVELLRVAANSTATAGIVTQTGTGDILNLFDGTTEVLTVKDGGSVGVGTVTPNAPLDVFSDTAATDKDLFMVRSSTGAFAVQCSSIAASNPEWRLRTYASEPIVFSPGNVEKVRITGVGSFGIGTNDPVSKLHLADDVTTTNNILTIQGTSWGDEEKVFTTYKRGSVHLGRFGVEADGAGQAGQLIFECGYGGSPVERLRINSSGKVGIGTINPQANLDFGSGSSNEATIRTAEAALILDVNSARAFRVNTNGSERLRIKSDGRVGIGTDDPSQRLTCYTDSGYAVLAQGPSNGIGLGNNGAIVFGNKSLGSYAKGILDATELEIKVSGSPKFNIDTSGKVGIGEDNPNATLHIQGAAATDGVRIFGGSSGSHSPLKVGVTDGTEYFRVNNDGNIGIGTNNPATILHLENDAPVLTVKATNASSGFRINVKGQSSGQLLRIQDDNTTKFVLEEGGNVGIGTDNPAKTLDVYGSFQVKDSGGTTRLLVHEDSGQFEVNQSVPSWTNTTHDPSPIIKWGWKSGCGNYMFTASGGNASTGAQMSHTISDGHGFKVGRSGYDGTDGDVSSTAEYFRITNAGKVGIGTGVPRATYLHVGNAGNTPGSVFTTSPLSVFASGNLGGTQFDDNKIAIFGGQSAGNVSGLSLYHYRRNTGTSWTTDGFSLRQEVDNTAKIYDYMNFAQGRVGIGTNVPVSALDVRNASGTNPLLSLHHSEADVEGEVIRIGRVAPYHTIRYHSINAKHSGAAASNTLAFHLHNGTTTTSQREVMRIVGNGFVGMGTDSPDTFLHVENGESTANTYVHVQNSHGGGGNAGVKIQNVNGEWTIIANNRLRIVDDDNSQDALQIEPGATTSSNRCLRFFGSGATGGSFATGSVAGDFEIKIRNLVTVNGNNWRPAQLWVIWRGMNGDATSNNRSLTYVRIGGLSTWSWSAYDTIEGSDLSPAIDTSDDTTTSCNIDFTGPGNTGTVWVWCSCWNASPTVEIIG